MFKGRRLLIATKHGKEQVLAPLLEEALGVSCFTHGGFDTDTLGTFSGELARTLDPVSAAREKCLRAAKAAGCDLVVGSEGSFGPHPLMPFVACDEEILLFLDLKNNLEIITRELSAATNFAAAELEDEQELERFAQAAGFPEHALILRKSPQDILDMRKGIRDAEELRQHFRLLKANYGKAYLETDMRAHCNPSRMSVIRQAGVQLIGKIQSCCPACAYPGFDVVEVRRGLECGLCGEPTRSALCHVYRCKNCGMVREEMYPNGKMQEDPMYCDVCNP
jgi:hypothetical protein